MSRFNEQPNIGEDTNLEYACNDFELNISTDDTVDSAEVHAESTYDGTDEDMDREAEDDGVDSSSVESSVDGSSNGNSGDSNRNDDEDPDLLHIEDLDQTDERITVDLAELDLLNPKISDALEGLSNYVFEDPPIQYNKTRNVAEIDELIYDYFSDDIYVEIPIETEVTDKKGNVSTELKPTKVKKVKVKKRKKRRNFIIGSMFDENFGDLLPFIKDINVTDINWNGKQLWIDDITKGRYVSDIVLAQEFVDGFSVRVSNVVSKTFNKYNPKLEAETDVLRITILHESVSHTGRAISIRKTPAVKRINFFKSIREGEYCTEEIANLMSNSVKAKFNIIICGLPGVGKTELVKFLTNYIFPTDRAITIEDTYEIHYSDINPGKDCLEIKVDEGFTYTDAIKVSLRLLPQWILLSEARSVEVKYLLESISTGTKCITTMHSDDVRRIPERVVNMLGELSGNMTNVINTVYNMFDLGIFIDKVQDPDTGKITRFISQAGLYTVENGVNKCVLLFDKGEMTGNVIPEDMMWKYRKAGIQDPYKYTFIQN